MKSINSTTKFDPYWLMNQTTEERTEVQQFLTKHGVNLDLCGYFELTDYAADCTFAAHHYKLGETGQPMWSNVTQEPVMDEPIIFSHKTSDLPVAVAKALHSA